MASAVVLKSDDLEITNFTSKIGKEIVISDEKDQTVINHLLEYLESVMEDKSNLFNLTNNLNENATKLNQEILTLKQENDQLAKEAQLHKKILQEHKDDFAETLIANPNLTDNKGLEKMLDKDQLAAVKDSIEDQRLKQYKDAIETHSTELKTVETQLNESKAELANYKKELLDRKSLEDQVNKLENELVEAREGNFEQLSEKEKQIEEQQTIIAEQIHMMQIMEGDINKLENVIAEMDEQLHQENQTKAELLDQLQIKEMDIAKAKINREKSTNTLLYKFANYRTTKNLYQQPSFASPMESVAHLEAEMNAPNYEPAATLKSTISVGFRSVDTNEWMKGTTLPLGSISEGMDNEFDDALHKQIEELRSSKLEMMKQLKSERADNGAKDKKIEKLEDQNSQLHEEVDELKEQIHEMESLASARRNSFKAGDKAPLLDNRGGANTTDKQTTGCVMFGLKVW